MSLKSRRYCWFGLIAFGYLLAKYPDFVKALSPVDVP